MGGIGSSTEVLSMSNGIAGLWRWLAGAMVCMALALPILLPRPANAWWARGGWGWGGVAVAVPPVVVAPPPVLVGPPVVAYAPPPVARWVPGHYNWRGFWVPGHWV